MPIIVLISFLVGCIVAQQGIFQLVKFGATAFVIDLTGILVLRELAVLLTSIMVAGRSGSAFTAEIGSMKMREEIDALRVMGSRPDGSPDRSPHPGAGDRAAAPDLHLGAGGTHRRRRHGLALRRHQHRRLPVAPAGAVGLNTFLVGLVKAPFMALVIGIIATIEGLAVQGSAESLGRHVTSSVVKAIFMVIVLDGIFAMFFAAIRY